MRGACEDEIQQFMGIKSWGKFMGYWRELSDQEKEYYRLAVGEALEKQIEKKWGLTTLHFKNGATWQGLMRQKPTESGETWEASTGVLFWPDGRRQRTFLPTGDSPSSRSICNDISSDGRYGGWI